MKHLALAFLLCLTACKSSSSAPYTPRDEETRDTVLAQELTRKAVESAKRGDDVELCKALRDPLSGMLKMEDPACSQRKDCAMFDRGVCTARNRSRRKPVPICYESSAGLLASAVVLAGAAGRRVIIVVPDPQALQEARA